MKTTALLVAILFTITLKAQQVSVDGGYMVITGTLRVGSNFTLNINGSLNSKGGSTIVFEGNGNQDISGNGAAGFNNITINNSSTGVRLQRDISVSGDLTMTDGDLDILDQQLSLGQNGDIVGENSNSMVKSTSGSGNYTQGNDAGDGSIVRTLNIGTSGVMDVGGMGIDITPTANWGSCQVSRHHQRIDDSSVFRSFKIIPTNSSNLESQITIQYDSDELNGNSSGSLKMYQITSNGPTGEVWEELSSTDNGSEVTATTNDNNLSEVKVTLAETRHNGLLPISLLTFKAFCDNEIVRLQWKTASEYNNDYFIIEKSFDGILYEEMARINGNGSTNTLSSYEFIDMDNENKTVYYRLSQVDYDGTITSFSPISSSCGNNAAPDFKIVNPAQNQLHFFTAQALNTEVEVFLFDMTGRLVFHNQLNQNERDWLIPVASLSQGVYQIRFSAKNFQQSKSITILNN